MQTEPAGTQAAAFMDIGTNSVRLFVVEISANRSYKILRKEKEMIRLGERGFTDERIQPEAIDRAVLVCAKLAQLARSFGVEDIMVVATAAAREAENKTELVARMNDQAGLDVRIISGLEEARLIYLGVSRSIHLSDRRALFIDIGGGSTEVIVGGQENYEYVDSLQLGAIRLTNLFFLPDEKGPVPHDRYDLVRQHVYNRAIRTVQRVKKSRYDLVVGSSGTVENLADIAVRMAKGERRTRDDALTHKQLRAAVARLCELPLEKRREVPGINPKRADIIIAGAAILDTFMETLQIKEILVSDQGLQDGLLVDYLASQKHDLHARPLSVRERSVLNLCRACHFDESHSRQVMALALQLFDSSRQAGLHSLGDWEKELLHFAALLHDIGMFLSYTDHEIHADYIIRNADLMGFDEVEIDIMAATAMFHRKRPPSKKDPQFASLGRRSRGIVRVLSMLLRMAESLDRSHTNVVARAALSVEDGAAVLAIEARGDCQLEEWNLRQHAGTFEKLFDRKLVVRSGTA